MIGEPGGHGRGTVEFLFERAIAASGLGRIEGQAQGSMWQAEVIVDQEEVDLVGKASGGVGALDDPATEGRDVLADGQASS